MSLPVISGSLKAIRPPTINKVDTIISGIEQFNSTKLPNTKLPVIAPSRIAVDCTPIPVDLEKKNEETRDQWNKKNSLRKQKQISIHPNSIINSTPRFSTSYARKLKIAVFESNKAITKTNK